MNIFFLGLGVVERAPVTVNSNEVLEPSSSPLLHIPAVQLEMDALVEKYGEGESEEEAANSTNQDKCLTVRRHTVGPANHV